jgi:hypothetical protein
LYIAIFSTASLAVGWHGAKALISHHDAESFERRIPLAKRARNHNGGIVIRGCGGLVRDLPGRAGAPVAG